MQKEDGGKLKSEYTFITSPTNMTVVFKCLPDNLMDMLKFEKKCLKLMGDRYHKFLRNLDKIRAKELQG